MTVTPPNLSVSPGQRVKLLSGTVGKLFVAEARRVHNESRLLQLLLVIVGGAIAGASQFIEQHAGGLDWHVIGLLGVALMALGGLQGVLREQSTAEALDGARSALEEARSAQTDHQGLQQYLEEADDKLRRLAHLHTAQHSMREAVEQCFGLAPKDEARAATTVLTVAATSIRSAIDFQMDESWTVSVYEAQTNASGQVSLVCIAADRFDGRAAANLTRSWALGVGHTGSTFAKADETVVPDLAATELGTLDRLPTPLRHATDAGRYRSIAAIPVRVLSDPIPWGVVVATSDRPSRFTLQHDEKGSLSAEAVRVLASMIALAVASQR